GPASPVPHADPGSAGRRRSSSIRLPTNRLELDDRAEADLTVRFVERRACQGVLSELVESARVTGLEARGTHLHAADWALAVGQAGPFEAIARHVATTVGADVSGRRADRHWRLPVSADGDCALVVRVVLLAEGHRAAISVVPPGRPVPLLGFGQEP